MLLACILARSTKRKFIQTARFQSLQSVSKQGCLSYMWLIKHPETQPHAVVMREQRVLFLFSCNHSLTLYSSIQSVKEVAVLPGIWQTNHPGKQSRGWWAIQEKSLKCGEQQHHWPSQVVSRQCWGFLQKTTRWSYFHFFFSTKKARETPIRQVASRVKSTSQSVSQ